jgi:glucan biosynthesis protein C
LTFVRNVAMLAVVIFHAVAAYSTVTPHWYSHDGSLVVADIVRKVFDPVMMPIFFFVAGYFGLASLKRKGVWPFLKGKLVRIGIPWLIAVFIFIPLAGYKDVASETSFVAHLLAYLKQIGTLRFLPIYNEGASQMDYWFLPLLLVFFFALGLFYSILRGRKATRREAPRPTTPQTPSNRSILLALLLTGTLTSVVSFLPRWSFLFQVGFLLTCFSRSNPPAWFCTLPTFDWASTHTLRTSHGFADPRLSAVRSRCVCRSHRF